MEETTLRRPDNDLEVFRKLQERLGKVKTYCEENTIRIGSLRDNFKKVRDYMGEVAKQQNVAIHHVVAGRKK